MCLVVPVMDSVSVEPWVTQGAVCVELVDSVSVEPWVTRGAVCVGLCTGVQCPPHAAFPAHELGSDLPLSHPGQTQAGFSPLQAKIVIRELLPNGLRESISKVRSSVAYAVSAIAHWDWPEAWPQLFNLLMEMLVSGDVNAVHGAMRVLTGTGAAAWPRTLDPMRPPLLPALTSKLPSHVRDPPPQERVTRGGPACRLQFTVWLYLDPTCSSLKPEFSWCVKVR